MKENSTGKIGSFSKNEPIWVILVQNYLAYAGDGMDRTQLRDDMVSLFNEAELQVICRRLDVPYERLGGKTQTDRTVSLIGWMDRNGRLPDLVAELVRERPHLRQQYAAYLPAPKAESDVDLSWLDRVAGGEGPAIEEPPTMRWDSDVHKLDES